jgi:ubiquinone/menaquinone biosynthesis C-methylase UbiE
MREKAFCATLAHMADNTTVFNAAEDYERFMGRWSRAIGEKFLGWLAAPPNARWLDVGCGTGAFSELIAKRCAPQSITGVDPSPEQIVYARAHLPDYRFEVSRAETMPFGDGQFDVVASALVLHFVEDRPKALAEMKRVLSPGGLVGGYTWKREGMREFAPYAPMLDGLAAIGVAPPHTVPVEESAVDGMRASLTTAGFTDVAPIEIKVTQTFANFDEYWEIQTLSFHRAGKAVQALPDAQRARLRDVLREKLVAADGTITYPATAIAGRGVSLRGVQVSGPT